MRVSPHQRSRVLHDGKETRKVVDFAIRISAVHHARQVEEVSALVQFGPQSALETLLGILEGLWLAEQVEMCEYTKDVSRHTGGCQHIKELHSLHFKAVVSVNHQQDNVGNLGNVHHGLELVGAFDKGQALFLGCHNRNGTLGVRDGFLGISADQRFQQGRLADSRRADNGHQAWRGFIGKSVDEGYVESLFFDLHRVN